MNAADTALDTAMDWSDANQHLLVAEFARLKLRLGGNNGEERGEGAASTALQAVTAARAAMPGIAAIDQLAESFDLSAFERDLLLLCAGVEMDAAIAERCASAHGDTRRAHASLGLALAALADPHWSALAPVRPLRRWRLLEVDESSELAQGRLRIDERVLHYLAGVNYLDPRLQSLLRARAVPDLMAQTHRDVCANVLTALEQRVEPAPAVMLVGDDPSGQADIAAQAAAAMGLALYAMPAEDVPQNPAELDALAVLWQREAVLLTSALLIDCGDEAAPKTVARFLDRLGGLVFMAGREAVNSERAALRFAVNKPDAAEQKRLWEQALGAIAGRLNGSLDAAASQFRLSAQTILKQGISLRPALAGSDTPDALMWSTCRGLGRPRLDELVQRIEPGSDWHDLILPPAQAATLRQIAAQVKQRLKVYQDWGFADKGARGLGISALFAGESGTGKTMAAEVLARELRLDLYRIDLSAVVSKYIGETEKNLRRVFDSAEDSGAILLFDEADALFGKRSEVKDSHDRYANIEVSYLLQRMEAYRGLAILTTNQRAALDTAFLRRLRFVVHFPFPDVTEREAIWRRVFPTATPTHGLDCAKLARLHMAGGHIRNIALNAAFHAAEDGEAVSMAHLLRAAHAEAAKRERPLTDAETRGWV
jgi:hypothetical protein